MQETQKGRIVKIVSPFQFLLQDASDKSKIRIEIKSTTNRSFEQILPVLFQENINYVLEKKKSHKIRQQLRKGSIFINSDELTSLYKQKHAKEYMDSELEQRKKFTCFVSKVQCLKIELINLSNLKYLTFYFSELKLIRVGNIHPKEMWERSQQYFKNQIQGQFIELTISGSQSYKEQVNIFGQIVRIRDGVNIREKTISDGYAQLSKDSEKYLSKQLILKYNGLRDKARQGSIGLWQASKNINKSNMQAQQFKYKEWEDWIKQSKALSRLKNEQDQFKIILEELNKLNRSQGKLQHNKLKIIIDVMITLFQNQINKRHLKFLEEVVRVFCILLSNMQIPFYQHLDSLDYIKSINKMIVFLIFYQQELEKLIQYLKGEKLSKNSSVDFEKCIKFIFKLCFLGNETFHNKLFGKHKENNYQNFNFQNVYLEGGFSSLSECSDYQQGDKLSKEQKKQRKLHSAHQKIRINATNLLSSLFKYYPNIVQNYWQMCVTSNILAKDFLSHVKKLKITTSQVKMSSEQKKEIVNLMRSNFGDHSLILLSIFQKNNKVKSNSINCLLNMISNFQGKKLIATTQSAYIEKLLKETKSSFVPKSFIVFSALRNALYFLLFTLYYQKNLQIVILIFKTLCQLCNNCTLIDKMSFEEGMGLLLSNYIVPVLQFEWNIVELQELKILCINFLSVLVNNNRKWSQIQEHYLKSSTNNINKQLMDVIQSRSAKANKISQDKLVIQIINYFTKLSKNYYSTIFYKLNESHSIWKFLEHLFSNTINHSYSQFVQQIFKGYFDQVQMIHSASNKTRLSTSIQMKQLAEFLVKYLEVYSLDVSPTNYLHLLGAITYIDYNYWSKEQFSYVKSFLLHCFYSFVEEGYQDQQFPSIKTITGNSFVRIALIKLLGYISFCPEFQIETISKKSVNCLLQLSKQYKSLNSMVKISWGLSNWAKVNCFSTSLNQKQLKACLQYMMVHSESDKQKIASNCTRGIGFFVSNVGKTFNFKECRQQIIKNLSHPILKVRTNSTKTLIALSEDLTESQVKELLPILEQNILRNNYHLQMETLQLLKKMGNPIQSKRLIGLFVSILKNLLNYKTLEYEFSEIKTIRQLRFTVLSQIFEIKEEIKKHPQLVKDILTSICQFLVTDCNEKYNKTESDSKIIEKQFEKSKEAEQLIFNKGAMEEYNQEKVITTQLMNKGLVYIASAEQLKLITEIKEFCVTEGQKINEQWAKLSNLRIQGSTIFIDFSNLQLGDEVDELTFITKD